MTFYYVILYIALSCEVDIEVEGVSVVAVSFYFDAFLVLVCLDLKST